MIADDAGERGLLETLASGRAVLLLGQNHSPTLRPALLSDIAAGLGVEAESSLRGQLLGKVEQADLVNVRRALDLHSPSDEVLQVTGQPWSLALTSAVDTIVTEAFRQASATSRGLRLLFPSQIAGQLARPGRDVLTVMRLFGSLEEQEERFLPPLTRLALRQRQSFEVAAVLRELPSLVGPYGCLVVVGVDADDWIDLGDLALACSQLPTGSVHWFGSDVPDGIREDMGDVLVHHELSFGEDLARSADSVEGKTLARVRSELFRPHSRTLSLSASGVATSFVLSPDEWRNVSRVGVLLDDSVLEPAGTLGPDEGREAFRAFLRHQQHVPEWEGVARGFLFAREQGGALIQEVERTLTRLGSVHDRSASGDAATGGTSRSRLPILLTGPPACGKSRLLHWLAFQLRRRGHVVLYLITPAGRLHNESVERVCRILESKGAGTVLVFADGLDEATYTQLNENLASSGRNALVIGARSGYQPDSSVADDPRKQSGFPQFRGMPIAANLVPSELERFSKYLSQHGFEDVALQPSLMGERYFLLLLYRLLPDVRGNVHASLISEYDRLLSTLDKVQEDDEREGSNDLWKTQLAEIKDVLFGESDDPPAARSQLAHFEGGTRAVNLSLFCAQIGKPLPLDLLLRTEDQSFLRSYREFALAVESTSLLQEVEVDTAGTVVLDADHQLIAQLTLASVMPQRSDQLRLLRALVDAVAWDESAFPGDRPDQDYCIEVLQAVGPRGVAEREFQSQPALEVVAQLLARVRTQLEVRIPKLLLLEANTLRLLADRSAADYETGLARCDEALAVLDIAERILVERRPTVARNSELRHVLTTRATVHGFVLGNRLQKYREVDESMRAQIREEIFRDLGEVDRIVTRTRGLGEPSFYPLDVTFWAYRDTFELLPDLSDAERLRLLERMESVLDAAGDDQIESNQLDRFQRRAVNLAALEGNVMLGESLAKSMREQGDFSGECLLVRREVFEPGSRRAKSRAAARAGLDRLESFGISAFGSAEALDLMHSLWRASYLPDTELGGPDPVFASCSQGDWLRWRRILDARVGLFGPGQNLFLGFCLSWTLFQLGESRLGLQEIRAVEPLSGGSRRRVGCLVVLSDADGKGIEFRAAVRRREGDTIIAYISALLAEVRLPPAMLSRLALLPQVGDELQMEIGLNYRGLLPWRLL